MKKRNQMFILISFTVLLSCTNVKKESPKEEAKSNTKVISPIPTTGNLDHDSTETKKYDDVLPSINYSFSNDTLCQTISIKEINKNGKLEIPEKLKFKLMLHDKQNKYADKVFEGVAKLSSPEESFSDNSDKDGGDYFAADYNFKAADYKIQIRLDIQNYEACVVLVTTSRPDIILGGYSIYLKKFPNDGVMKKGECK
jgi:hypothetical protein